MADRPPWRPRGTKQGGQVFSDPDSGVAITTEWTDANQALVSVDFSGDSAPVCTHNDPIVSMTPGQNTWLPAGSSFSYSVSITNMDSAACASNSFSLSASLSSSLSLARRRRRRQRDPQRHRTKHCQRWLL